MRSKLFEMKPKTVQISTQRWIKVLPDQGEGFPIYDALEETLIGRILMNENDDWIYDGRYLTVDEQEEVAGLITGHRQAMEKLIRNL